MSQSKKKLPSSVSTLKEKSASTVASRQQRLQRENRRLYDIEDDSFVDQQLSESSCFSSHPSQNMSQGQTRIKHHSQAPQCCNMSSNETNKSSQNSDTNGMSNGRKESCPIKEYSEDQNDSDVYQFALYQTSPQKNHLDREDDAVVQNSEDTFLSKFLQESEAKETITREERGSMFDKRGYDHVSSEVTSHSSIGNLRLSPAEKQLPKYRDKEAGFHFSSDKGRKKVKFGSQSSTDDHESENLDNDCTEEQRRGNIRAAFHVEENKQKCFTEKDKTITTNDVEIDEITFDDALNKETMICSANSNDSKLGTSSIVNTQSPIRFTYDDNCNTNSLPESSQNMTSQQQQPIISILNLIIDYTMEDPSPLSSYEYELFQDRKNKAPDEEQMMPNIKVPVVRIFGPIIRHDLPDIPSPSLQNSPQIRNNNPKQNGCVHIHNAFPYLLARVAHLGPDADLTTISTELWDDQKWVSNQCEAISSILESTLITNELSHLNKQNVSTDENSNSATVDSAAASSLVRFIRDVSVVCGRAFYTYCTGSIAPFLKITYYNPSVRWKIKSTLERGLDISQLMPHPITRINGGGDTGEIENIDKGTPFRCFEAHIPYTMQIFKDYNLAGMAYTNFREILFRKPLPSKFKCRWLVDKKREQRRCAKYGNSKGDENKPVENESTTSLFLDSNVPKFMCWDGQALPNAEINSVANNSNLCSEKTVNSNIYDKANSTVNTNGRISSNNDSEGNKECTNIGKVAGLAQKRQQGHTTIQDHRHIPGKETCCEIEFDTTIDQILNIQDVITPELEKKENVDVHWRVVPSLREIWAEERCRMAKLLPPKDDFLSMARVEGDNIQGTDIGEMNRTPDHDLAGTTTTHQLELVHEKEKHKTPPFTLSRPKDSYPGTLMAVKGIHALFKTSHGLEETFHRSIRDIANRHARDIDFWDDKLRAEYRSKLSRKKNSKDILQDHRTLRFKKLSDCEVETEISCIYENGSKDKAETKSSQHLPDDEAMIALAELGGQFECDTKISEPGSLPHQSDFHLSQNSESLTDDSFLLPLTQEFEPIKSYFPTGTCSRNDKCSDSPKVCEKKLRQHENVKHSKTDSSSYYHEDTEFERRVAFGSNEDLAFIDPSTLTPYDRDCEDDGVWKEEYEIGEEEMEKKLNQLATQDAVSIVDLEQVASLNAVEELDCERIKNVEEATNCSTDCSVLSGEEEGSVTRERIIGLEEECYTKESRDILSQNLFFALGQESAASIESLHSPTSQFDNMNVADVNRDAYNASKYLSRNSSTANISDVNCEKPVLKCITYQTKAGIVELNQRMPSKCEKRNSIKSSTLKDPMKKQTYIGQFEAFKSYILERETIERSMQEMPLWLRNGGGTIVEPIRDPPLPSQIFARRKRKIEKSTGNTRFVSKGSLNKKLEDVEISGPTSFRTVSTKLNNDISKVAIIAEVEVAHWDGQIEGDGSQIVLSNTQALSPTQSQHSKLTQQRTPQMFPKLKTDAVYSNVSKISLPEVCGRKKLKKNAGDGKRCDVISQHSVPTSMKFGTTQTSTPSKSKVDHYTELSNNDPLLGIGQQGGKIHVEGGGLKVINTEGSAFSGSCLRCPLTMLSVEIHVQCRFGKTGARDANEIAMKPDPSRDAIFAVVYIYAKDPGGGEEIELVEQGCVFVPVEAELVDSYPEQTTSLKHRTIQKNMGLGSFTTMEEVKSEKDLLLRFASIVQWKDPDALMSWDTQGSGLGYLIERGTVQGTSGLIDNPRTDNQSLRTSVDMARLLGRTPRAKIPEHKSFIVGQNESSAGMDALRSASSSGQWSGSGLGADWDDRVGAGAAAASITGRLVFCVWKIISEEVKHRNSSYQPAMVSTVLRRRIPFHDDLTLTRWFGGDKGRQRWRVVNYRLSQAKANILLFDALDAIGRAGEAARLSGTEFSQSFPGIRGSQYKVEGVLLRALQSVWSNERGEKKGKNSKARRAGERGWTCLSNEFVSQKQSPWKLHRGDISTANDSCSTQFDCSRDESYHNRGYFFFSPSKDDCSRQEALECQALTLEPKSGFHYDPVVVCDFTALYPSLVIAYNLCYSTCAGKLDYTSSRQEMRRQGSTTGNIGPFPYPEYRSAQVINHHIKSSFYKYNKKNMICHKKKDRAYTIPTGAIFVSENVLKGVLPQVLDEMLATRAMLKRASKLYKDKGCAPSILRQLEARQLALKYVANVTYGYTSATFSGRSAMPLLADAIVECGRRTLANAISLANDLGSKEGGRWNGAEVIYGDTDSLFIKLPGRSVKDAFEFGREFCTSVTASNPPPVELKLEKVYHATLLQTKKKYCGMKYDSPKQKKPVFEAKGIETVRRDQCLLTQKILRNALITIFRRGVRATKDYLCRQWKMIHEGSLPVSDFVLTGRVRSCYRGGKIGPVQAALARRLAESDPGRVVRHKERLPYVIVATPGITFKLRDCVLTPMEILTRWDSYTIHSAYYATKHVNAALQRCLGLSPYNIDVNTWYESCPKPRKRIHHWPITRCGGNAMISTYFGSDICTLCGVKCKAKGSSKVVVCDTCHKDHAQVSTVALRRLNTAQYDAAEAARICGLCNGCPENGRTFAQEKIFKSSVTNAANLTKRGTRKGAGIVIPIANCVCVDCPITYERHRARESELEALALCKELNLL